MWSKRYGIFTSVRLVLLALVLSGCTAVRVQVEGGGYKASFDVKVENVVIVVPPVGTVEPKEWRVMY